MEKIILIGLLVISFVYLVIHMKRVLTIGEVKSNCPHCPVARPSLYSDNKSVTQDNSNLSHQQ